MGYACDSKPWNIAAQLIFFSFLELYGKHFHGDAHCCHIYVYIYVYMYIYMYKCIYIYIYYVYNIYVYLYFFIYICIWPNRSVEGIFQQIWHHIHQNTAHLDHVWSNLSALVLLPLECSRRGGARSRRSNSDAGKMDQTWSGHSPNHPYLATYEKTHDFAELDIC